MSILKTHPQAAPEAKAASPGSIHRPCYLLCPPFSHDARVPNNVWMTEYREEDRQVDKRRALVQFLDLYNFLASDALVYLLPAPAASGLQDQVFTANLAFVPEHVERRDVAIVSNFTSPPRVAESFFGRQFFESMGYQTLVCPHRFEGEAEIKHLHDNVYAAGYGERSEREAYDWMQERLGMEIVPIHETEPHLYHLDCTIFPLTREETLVCTEALAADEVKALERHTNVVDVSLDAAFSGICNSVRMHNLVLNASNIFDLKPGTEEYALEIAKNRALEDICADRGFEVAHFNLSEYMKSGALLSCMVMHLNRYSYEFQLK